MVFEFIFETKKCSVTIFSLVSETCADFVRRASSSTTSRSAPLPARAAGSVGATIISERMREHDLGSTKFDARKIRTGRRSQLLAHQSPVVVADPLRK